MNVAAAAAHILITRNAHGQLVVFGVTAADATYGEKVYHRLKIAEARAYAGQLAARAGVAVREDERVAEDWTF